jgi:hypothetical protein
MRSATKEIVKIYLKNLGQLRRKLQKRKAKFEYKAYWEERYKYGGNSGAGSYSENADYKASRINQVVKSFDVRTVLEFGCGDGNNLSLYKFDHYLGLDVSNTAV